MVRQTVGTILVKFCDTGNNIVPATSQNIAISKKEYVLTIIKYFIIN